MADSSGKSVDQSSNTSATKITSNNNNDGSVNTSINDSNIIYIALQQIQQAVSNHDDRITLRMLRKFKTIRKNIKPEQLLQISTAIFWDRQAAAAAAATVINGGSGISTNVGIGDKSSASSTEDTSKIEIGGSTSGIKNQNRQQQQQQHISEATKIYWGKLKELLERCVATKDSSDQTDMKIDIPSFETYPKQLLRLTESSCAQPEYEIYIHTLLLLFCIDNNYLDIAKDAGPSLVERLCLYNRRSMDYIGAKAWFYWFRVAELSGDDANCRPLLLQAYRSASVQHDMMTQATLMNLLLRSYINSNLYDVALKLVSKTCFPEGLRSNAQHSRYLYYIGVIQAVRLEYSAAFAKLQMALRKAPQQPGVARGFRLSALKKSIVVELLMGDIPERCTFNRRDVKKDLIPYRNIVLAVRSGDLHAFSSVMKVHQRQFERDKTWVLIQRLRHNVIRAGLRIISLSYSRIPLKDVASKLGLESSQDAESVVSKAIFDGVIEATINHQEQFVQSKASVDLYTSNEPQKAFYKRITFCLDVYTDAIKSMQYPDGGDSIQRDGDADERRKALQEEIARAEDEDIGDDLDMI